jgi:hypothetical protein
MGLETDLAQFDTQQARYAVMLSRLVRKTGDADFDVLCFCGDWQYAETTINQCLASDHPAVADAALHLMQLRLRFEQALPERARQMGLARNATSLVPATG